MVKEASQFDDAILSKCLQLIDFISPILTFLETFYK